MRGFLMMRLSVALVCLAVLDVAVADEECEQRSGTCQDTSNYCSGLYWSGYCNGASNRRCCIPDSRTGDSRCIAKGGHCKDESTCDGEALRGYCAGAANRKCCIAGSKCISGSSAFSDNCLNCICEIEGCRKYVGKECNWDVNSLSCGPFQIKKDYYTDCYEPGSGWQSCTKQMECSKSCVRAYMNRYACRCVVKKAHRNAATMTCQDYARVHNGGPEGCIKSSTVKYWKNIEKCCLRVGGC
ncbi:Lysozyme 1 [Lamellibrachia satsuma]|nr:Lysozyme 1 [Lamellibrachia satsuma]